MRIIPKCVPERSRAAREAPPYHLASVHDVDFLLTWNCQHIANAAIMKELGEIVAEFDFDIPILCTPEELLGGSSNG